LKHYRPFCFNENAREDGNHFLLLASCKVAATLLIAVLAGVSTPRFATGQTAPSATTPQPSAQEANRAGYTALDRGDYATALTWFLKSAALGDKHAQDAIGFMYYNGNGVARDDAQALSWFRKAAEQDLPDAQMRIGLMYSKGQVTAAEDHVQAAIWYRKAADQGWAQAQTLLGEMYKSGRGVPKDCAQAMDLFQKAAAQGDPEAEAQIGSMYRDGLCVPQDLTQAMAWYRKAADHGLTVAREELNRLQKRSAQAPTNNTVPPAIQFKCKIDIGMYDPSARNKTLEERYQDCVQKQMKRLFGN
jgi:tetratricopeptide (TPR) repeat protein